jgi:hypothetical protein
METGLKLTLASTTLKRSGFPLWHIKNNYLAYQKSGGEIYFDAIDTSDYWLMENSKHYH